VVEECAVVSDVVEIGIIYSIEKGIRVLEYICLSSEDLSVTELSRAMGINKTTIYRILQTFIKTGFLEQDRKTERYRPTMKILTLSNRVLNRMEIRSLANRYLKELAGEINESVHLALMDGYETVIIDKVESSDEMGIKFHIGRRSPLYSTGTGKVFLASLPEEDLKKYFAISKFVQYTPTTYVDPAKLREEIVKIRECGYALDHQENNIGISCVAAPICDYSGKVIAAMSATGPSFRIDSNTGLLRTKVVETAQVISKRLGHLS
jgi:IclR family KDG regulon transcriptional repressor